MIEAYLATEGQCINLTWNKHENIDQQIKVWVTHLNMFDLLRWKSKS